MEIVDLEKMYSNEMSNLFKAAIDTNLCNEPHTPGNIASTINSFKNTNHQQVISRQASVTVDPLEISSKLSHPQRVSVFSRSEADTFRENFLKKRRATRLGSNVEDSPNEDEEPPTPGGILARYVERASVPGLAYLYTSRTRLARIAWCGMLLITLGALTLHMFYLVDTYLSWQKHTQVTLGFDALQFPAVTFCNVNPARTSKLKLASKELQDLAHKIKPDELAQQMLHQSIVEASSLAKEKLQEEAEGTKYEGAVNGGINFVDNLFRVGQAETDKSRERNNNNNNRNSKGMQEIEDGSDRRFSGNSTSTNDTSATFIELNATAASPSAETSNDKATKNGNGDTPASIGDVFRDIFRGKRSASLASAMRRIKRAFPSLPRKLDPPSVDVDLEEVIEDLQGQESDKHVSPSVDVTTQSQSTENPSSELSSSTEQVTTNRLQSTLPQNPESVTTDPTTSAAQTHPSSGEERHIPQSSSVTFSRLTSAGQTLPTENQNLELSTPNLPALESSESTEGPDLELEVNRDHVSTTQNNAEPLGVTQGLVDELETNESHEEPQPMKFINDLDLVGTNVRSEVERSVFSEQQTFFTEPSAMANIRQHFTYLFSKENRSTRVAMGHKMKDMLVDCSFQGGRCRPKDFKLLSSPTYGNCYTMDYSNMRVLRSGPANGLSLIVFLENDEYLKGLTSGSGGQLVIHKSNSFAFPDSDGLALAAGMEVHIAIRMTRISRLGRPYGDCENGDVFKASFEHGYTRRTCQHFCEHTLIATHCGCYDTEDEEIQLIMQNLDSKAANVDRPCDTLEDFQCMAEIEKKHLMRELDCDCKNPCLDVTYTKTISSRQWPTDDFAEVLIQTLCESRGEKECKKYKNIDKRLFSLNFLKVNIFYEDLNYENITEQASYELTQFYSDIGGALGLWMGLSVIAVLEVLHFLTSLLRLLVSVLAARVKSLSRLLSKEKSSTEPMRG